MIKEERSIPGFSGRYMNDRAKHRLRVRVNAHACAFMRL